MRHVRTSWRQSRRGFTLVEMLTVAAIIAILSTVALASLRRARGMAIETSAVGGGKTIANAEYQYFARKRVFGSFTQMKSELDLIDRRYDSRDDLSTTLDNPIVPFYSVIVQIKTDTFQISLVPMPGAPYDLRTFVAGGDGSVSVVSGSSLVPVYASN